ncbi:M24 family metallopeptidase [Lacticaseibacillus saniviri]
MMAMRVAQLASKLADAQLDALIVTDPVNLTYLTGFTGDESVLIVSASQAMLVTDGRFTTQVAQEAPALRVVLHTDGLFPKVGQVLDDQKLKRVGFDAADMRYQQYQALADHTQAALVPNEQLITDMRAVKSDAEVQLIQRAIDITMRGYDEVLNLVHPGMTERHIANHLAYFLQEQGATGLAFETIVASGARGAMPHGAATERAIEAGDVITLDFGASYQGYAADVTRTFAVGQPDAQLQEVYRVAYQANRAGAASLAPGVSGRDLDTAVRDVIVAAGFGQYYNHGTGHGIGLSIHEAPGAWRPYMNAPQVVGNVETIEPGIYLPDLGGVRIEDDFLVTTDGNRQLTPAAPSELLVI